MAEEDGLLGWEEPRRRKLEGQDAEEGQVAAEEGRELGKEGRDAGKKGQDVEDLHC